MKKLLSIILSITMLLSSAVIVSADGVEGPKPIEKVKVAINAEFPPFEYYENDELKGFDIDLMNAIGEKIGFEIEYVNVHFDAILPSLLSGRVDCGISAITITEERENNFDFTRPYLTAKTTNPSMGSEEYEEYADYAIVFPESTYEKSKVLLAAGERSIYAEVNNAIEQFSKDGTIEKLIEKYKLNESLTDGGSSVTHTVASYTPTNDDENKNPATSATSVPYSDWAKSDIEKAISLNIINYGGNYNYTGSITREEFCEIIYNYCANVIGKLETIDGTNKFTDTNNAHIQILNAAGIINGKSETEFAPDDFLTREEAAVILNRMVNYTIPVPVTEMYFAFDDEAKISDWASDSIQVMCNMGVMNGVGENNFAPQEIYTTEQAIVTVVRVYAAQSANTGIIGGADTPTEIYIGEDVEVSDFYIDEALKHTVKAGELAGTKEFISMYVNEGTAKERIERLSKVDFTKPVQMYYLTYNTDKVIEYYNKMLAEESPGVEFDVEKYFELNRFNLSYFANQLNARNGSDTIVATSVLTSREGYIMPKDFENDFAIYLQYEGDFSALVSFSKIGDGVIEARMQFVSNSEKSDMLMFMSELYTMLGEECITVGKIK